MTAEDLKGVTGAGIFMFGPNRTALRGALSKTRSYTRGVLTNITLYSGARDKESETAAIRYHTGTGAIKDRVSYVVNVDGAKTVQEVLDENYVLQSRTLYDNAGITQYRGSELPTETFTYYEGSYGAGGQTLESETTYTYGGYAGGLLETERRVYSPCTGMATPQETVITSIYDPQEPGTGLILESDTYTDGDHMSHEDYIYDTPYGGQYSQFDGLFSKLSLSRRESESYHLDGSTSTGTLKYKGYKGFEKPWELTGTMPGMTADYKTVYDHDLIMKSLKLTYTYDLPDDMKKTTWHTGFEGEEQVVTVKEYRAVDSDDPDAPAGESHELATVSRFYYDQWTGQLINKITDNYVGYGSSLYGIKPVTRKFYEYAGEAGHERIISETDDRGIIQYYKYFVDSQKGLITAITSSPDDLSTITDINSQVLSDDLMSRIYSDPNYISSQDGTATFIDRDGTMIMSVDGNGSVSKYDYKRSGGEIQRDQNNGNPVETYIHTADGSKITKNSENHTIAEERVSDRSGDIITINYDYEMSGGEIETDERGNPIKLTKTWTGWQFEPTSGSSDFEGDWTEYQYEQVFVNGELFSQKTVKDGAYTSGVTPFRWKKESDGSWRFYYNEDPEQLESEDSFTIKVGADGSIQGIQLPASFQIPRGIMTSLPKSWAVEDMLFTYLRARNTGIKLIQV